MEKRKHISFSEYRLYAACSFKHAIQYRLKLQEGTNEFLVFGSALHSSIEEIIQKKHSKILYEKVFKKYLEIESNIITLNSYFGRNFSIQGTAILKTLDFFERFKEYDVVGVEEEIMEPLFQDEDGEFKFKGIIDLILKHKETGDILIIDWKSATKPWDIDKKKEDKGFFGQLALYKHFFSKKHNIPLDKITTRFVALARDPIDVQQYEIKISDEFREYIVEDMTRVAKEIKQQLPSTELTKAKSVSLSACKYCAFNKGICTNDLKQDIDTKNEEEKSI